MSRTPSLEVYPQKKSSVISAVLMPKLNRKLFYGHHIELPKQGTELTGNTLTIAGWAVGKTPVSKVEVVYGGKKIDEIPVNLSRPKLHDAFGVEGFGGTTNFAFKADIDIPALDADNSTLSLRAVFADDSRTKLGTIDLSSRQFYDRLQTEAKPDFIIIGAMKSATSAVYEYLMQHPDVLERHPKELSFFSRKNEFEKGLLHYFSYFSDKLEDGNSKKIIGEASPAYLFSKDALSRISETLPDVKLIILLRNPVDRAISHFYHQRNRVKDESRTVEEAFSEAQITQAEKLVKQLEGGAGIDHNSSEWLTARYLATGHYSVALRRWLKYFSPEQLLILNYHQLESDPEKLMTDVFEFLQLPHYSIPNLESVFANKYSNPPQPVIDRLTSYYIESNQDLYNSFDIGFTFPIAQAGS